MKAISKIMLSGAAVAALVASAPAAAQYPYGGYNNGYNSGNNVVGQILNSILGGRSYQQNDRYAIDMCIRATEARLNGYQGGYGYSSGYGQYGGYGNNGYSSGYAGARVTSITNVQRRSNGLKIYGIATSNGAYGNNAYGGYNGGYNNGYNNGYPNNGYNNAYGAQLRFNCKVDRSGRVYDVDIDRRRY